MRLNYARDRRRVGYFDRTAKSAAGLSKDKGTEDGVENGKEKEKGREKKEGVASKERRRKVKVPMVEGSEFSGTLELIVEGDEVFLVSASFRPWSPS